ncbi:MAG: hypothetical protein HYS27_02090 [Deltaproteobacteria bacterium]|nr:hypothetical protein [Deltaproteobacteria bacterium]
MKAAILLLNVGGGHQEAANNLKAALERTHPDIELRIIDGLIYTPRWFQVLFAWWWLKMQYTAPRIWGWMYESPLFATRFWSWWMYHIPWWGMRRELRAYRPDVVFITHFVCNPVAARVRRESKLDMRINYICTEFIWLDLYFRWPETDRYFFSTEKQREQAIASGIAAERIAITGIPIKPAFAVELSRQDARTKLDIPQDATVLFFFAGTFGGTNIDRIVDSMKGKNVYPVVVCGKSTEAKERIEKLIAKAGIAGKVYGFVDFMDVIMRAADLMVGKGGALMCAECLATGCPVLLYGSPPGHELGNAQWLETIGAGIVTNTIDDVLRAIDDLLGHPEKLRRMHEVSKAAGLPKAADNVVDLAIKDRLATRAAPPQLPA